MMDLEIMADNGELFDGRYRLIQQLSAAGGTADVWLAEDVLIKSVNPYDESDRVVDSGKEGMRVALKIYRPKNALDIEGEERFKEEFRVVFNCHHTNLLHPTNFSIYKDIPYLVLPYCPLGSSEQLSGQFTKEEDLYKYISDVASGLAYLHANTPAIIHQDIKPANVLMMPDGNYAITDFGITINTHEPSHYLNEEISGTLAYMAPERFNEGYEPIPQSDIWSFGATLYEIITGKVPFGEEGGASQIKGRIITKIEKPCPSNIKKLIYSCLNLDPNKRPTAQEIADTFSQGPSSKKSFNGSIVALLVLGVLLGIGVYFVIKDINFSNGSGSEEDTPSKDITEVDISVLTPEEEARLKYEKAVGKIPTQPLEAFREVSELSAAGNSKATYLLSRLYFQSNKESENIDSIARLRELLKLTVDNAMAHEMLCKAVEQDSTNYIALYELGCDYMAGHVRDPLYKREPEKALPLFKSAEHYAKNAGDKEYENKAKQKIRRIN